MDINLTPIEARILGALIEKEMTTPDYYPLTLNALVNACNQKTNREPVMELNDATVEESLVPLRNQRLAFQVKSHGSRSLKYKHNLEQVFNFNPREKALLCLLLLRGPQTLGELRTRSARMAEFPTISAVEAAVQKLIDIEGGPFVTQLPRRPGQKESRYAHLLGEEKPAEEAADTGSVVPVPPQEEPMEAPADDRLEVLEQRVEALTAELTDLREAFARFKRQFE